MRHYYDHCYYHHRRRHHYYPRNRKHVSYRRHLYLECTRSYSFKQGASLIMMLISII